MLKIVQILMFGGRLNPGVAELSIAILVQRHQAGLGEARLTLKSGPNIATYMGERTRLVLDWSGNSDTIGYFTFLCKNVIF